MGMALPDDVLADVLRRLAPRSLAASRCVCKAWRAIVDTRRLLLPDLLPHSVGGIFLMYHDLAHPVFLSRPSTGPEISGKLDFLTDPDADLRTEADVLDHCNGLLLYEDPHGLHVANPATRQWARLPPPPRFWQLLSLYHVAHLVFDPTESPHYEVLLFPENPIRDETPCECEDDRLREWPASTCVVCVFSSRTGRWEERAFAREGEAAGKLADMSLEPCWSFWRGYGAYWRGAFYLCNRVDFLVRISLSNDKYQAIKMPPDIEWEDQDYLYLGRSAKGVCCALVHGRYDLQVWILDESCGHVEWVLKHQIDLKPSAFRVLNYGQQIQGPWILQAVSKARVDEEFVEEKFEWDSDNDNVLDTEYEVEGILDWDYEYITFLGFHPYKDVVFLNVGLTRVAAYHLNSSMVQDLEYPCKMPPAIEWEDLDDLYLGRSEEGVCCAVLCISSYRYGLQVWILDESCGLVEWVLKHQIDLKPSALCVLNYGQQIEGRWILQAVSNAHVEQKFEWDSDNDNVLDTEYEVEGILDWDYEYITFLGFHPYKDVVFLNVGLTRVVPII